MRSGLKKINITKSSIEDTLLIGLLLFAPLALASVHTWAYCTIAIVSLTIFNLHFLNNIDDLKKTFRIPISIGLVVFLVINLLYLIPLPAVLIKFFSHAAYSLKEEYMLSPVPWQTLSIYSRATIGYIIKLVSYMMIFFVIVSKITQSKIEHQTSDIEDRTSKIEHRAKHYANKVSANFLLLGALTSILTILFHSISDFNLHIPANALYFTVILSLGTGLSLENRESNIEHQTSSSINYHFVSRLVNAIIIIGFSIAVFGIIQKLSWNGKIYWLIKKDGGNFGPYINSDHYAGFMGMCTCLAVAYFMGSMRYSSFFYIKNMKEKILWFSSPEANKILIYLFLSIVMTTALFLTASRGGILSFAASILVFFFSCIIITKRGRRNRLFFSVFLVILLICTMIIWVGPESTIERFNKLNKIIRFCIKEKAILCELRPYMWTDTVDLIKDFPIFGTGLGAFSYIFPKYRTFPGHYGFLRYAHSDYLQFVSGMGIIGLVFIIGFFVWYFRRFRDCLRRLRQF
ncbi:O-antigen ligase family protein [Candidatus Omnitrophota bacterium]